MLKVAEVSKSFGGIKALDKVSFDVHQGELVGLIGPNGSGKSTMFNVICGIYRADSGTITFKDKEITKLPPYRICRSGIGRTFQLVKLFESMTVLQNVTVGATFGRDLEKEDRLRKCTETLRLTGLSDKMHYYTSNLTIGDKRRLEMARALAAEPDLLLLDETAAGLNATEADSFMALVRKIRDMGVTTLMIEHVMKTVMGICERIIVLDQGKKIAEGSPSEVRADKRVIESYLGSENAS
jgi:branched-chain amino acid transport system ATP-binding protein